MPARRPDTTNRRSAIDRTDTRHPGYAISQRIRKRVEEIFGWPETVGGFRRTRYRGRPHGWRVPGRDPYNLVRLSRLALRRSGVQRQPDPPRPARPQWPHPGSETTARRAGSSSRARSSLSGDRRAGHAARAIRRTVKQGFFRALLVQIPSHHWRVGLVEGAGPPACWRAKMDRYLKLLARGVGSNPYRSPSCPSSGRPSWRRWPRRCWTLKSGNRTVTHKPGKTRVAELAKVNTLIRLPTPRHLCRSLPCSRDELENPSCGLVI